MSTEFTKFTRAYCYTELVYHPHTTFNVGEFYIVERNTEDYYLVKHSELLLYNAVIFKDQFKACFYTEEEYREKQLDKLLFN